MKPTVMVKPGISTIRLARVTTRMSVPKLQARKTLARDAPKAARGSNRPIASERRETTWAKNISATETTKVASSSSGPPWKNTAAPAEARPKATAVRPSG